MIATAPASIAKQLGEVLRAPAVQQPGWSMDRTLPAVLACLSAQEGLVPEQDLGHLHTALRSVALGQARVLQAGDCAEPLADCHYEDVELKANLVAELADLLRTHSDNNVVAVGRIAGQYAKPRSRAFEPTEDGLLPSYRGPMVNAPGSTLAERIPDPQRMLNCVEAARKVMSCLRSLDFSVLPAEPYLPAIWTSHEALVLDYELSMVRPLQNGGLFLASTHWPWIGERTRDPNGAHVKLLAQMANPVACKIGPDIKSHEIRSLAQALDPQRRPGRLTFIVRMGADLVSERLPPMVRALKAEGHVPIWLSDPMHGNTILDANGMKRRVVSAVRSEAINFCAAVQSEQAEPGGLHLEVATKDVAECVWDFDELSTTPYRGDSLCDPRLNPEQARHIAAEFASAIVART